MKPLRALTLPKSIWAIGLMTLLMNVSTVIIFSLSPLYLTKVLGVTALGIGLLEGMVEFISWVTRVFSGVISDAMRKRKPLLLVAVALTCIARPLFAVASTITGVFISRATDRIANGLQAPPRDALIGDSAPKNMQGSAFGLRQSLGMLGSTAGAMLTFFWLQSGDGNFTDMFWFAAVSPFIALLFILFMVRDNTTVARHEQAHLEHFEPAQGAQDVKPSDVPARKKSERINLRHIKTLPREYWHLLLVAFIFCMATYSGAFMILRGEEVTKLTAIGPAVMIAQNTMAMLVAYPLGRLFDLFDYRWLLALGFGVVICANTVFSFADSFTWILVGAGFWGMQMGINQSLLTASVSIITSESNRATAFGIYYITAGTAILVSNTVVGRIADAYGLENSFYYSTVMAVIAMLCLPFLRKRR